MFPSLDGFVRPLRQHARRDPGYPRHSPVNWSPCEAIPAPDHRAVRALIADAKHLIAARRASRLLRELGG